MRELVLNVIENYSCSWKSFSKKISTVDQCRIAFRLNCPPLFVAEDRLEVQAPQGFQVPRDCQAQVPCQDIVAM